MQIARVILHVMLDSAHVHVSLSPRTRHQLQVMRPTIKCVPCIIFVWEIEIALTYDYRRSKLLSSVCSKQKFSSLTYLCQSLEIVSAFKTIRVVYICVHLMKRISILKASLLFLQLARFCIWYNLTPNRKQDTDNIHPSPLFLAI
jgi:hypothetical protein